MFATLKTDVQYGAGPAPPLLYQVLSTGWVVGETRGLARFP